MSDTKIAETPVTEAVASPAVPAAPAVKPAETEPRKAPKRALKAPAGEVAKPAFTMHSCLVEAMACAQAEFTSVIKSKSYQLRGGIKIYYADLNQVIQSVRPALNRHGIMLTWDTSTRLVPDMGPLICVECILRGYGEELRSGVLELPLGSGNSTAQQIGSSMTYARRYTLSSLCGIAPDDDDDARGDAAVGAPVAAPQSVGPLAPELCDRLVESYRNGQGRAFWQTLTPEQKESSRTTPGLGERINQARAEYEARMAQSAPAPEAPLPFERPDPQL